MGKPQQIKTDKGLTYIPRVFNNLFFKWVYTLKLAFIIIPKSGYCWKSPYNFKNTIIKHKRGDHSVFSYPSEWAKPFSFCFIFLDCNEQGYSPADRHFQGSPPSQRSKILWKDLAAGCWQGPDPILMWGRGFVCVFQKEICRLCGCLNDWWSTMCSNELIPFL